ncbi:arylacetamide deacetylase-like [Haliotis rubra]|uniref:arylacetamide deacetylase-like n=1 Tax=Haliotis rubra TaxID=36100 RepID=UPI001EE590E4|nr:arylacetamide deacetylase-like [Haliotis rubra]
MGCLKVLAITISVLMIGLSAYLYTPVPDSMAEPWKLRSMLAGFKIVKLISGVSELVGLGSSVNVTRRLMKMVASQAVASKSDPLLKVTDTRLSGISVRIYRPKSAPTPSPALVYFHGGGWIFGSVDQYDEFTAEIAKAANIVVMSVEYRLAPEHPFPIPFEDCVTATLHLLQNPQQYGVDGTKIAVGGDSTGGNIAASAAMMLNSNEQLPNVVYQVLIYPPLQAFNLQLPSYTDTSNYHTTTNLEMATYWSHYIGPTSHPNLPKAMTQNQHVSPEIKKTHFSDLVDVKNFPENYYSGKWEMDKESGNETLWSEIEFQVVNPYLSPLLGHEIEKVPTALVVTAQYDVLRDDGMLYVERMRNAGINVTHRHYPIIHGMIGTNEFEISRKARKEIYQEIKAFFHPDNTE